MPGNFSIRSSSILRISFAKFDAFVGNFLAIPVVPVMKTESKKFPVVEDTCTIEAMRQDAKVLQASILHFLGQNFAKSSNIKFINKNGQEEYGWTAS